MQIIGLKTVAFLGFLFFWWDATTHYATRLNTQTLILVIHTDFQMNINNNTELEFKRIDLLSVQFLAHAKYMTCLRKKQ